MLEALERAQKRQRQDAIDAARYRWIEENSLMCGGAHGFEITCFVPFDEEDMGVGIDRAIAASKEAK